MDQTINETFVQINFIQTNEIRANKGYLSSILEFLNKVYCLESEKRRE